VTDKRKPGMVPELLLYSGAVILTVCWFVLTDAHVNEQALHTLYLPFVRTLRILDYFSFDGLELLKEVHHGNYPYGIYILPLLFYVTGLGFLGTSWPFLLCILLLSLFASACFLAFPATKPSMKLFVLIFSFPLFQISLKSFSPHSWNVLFGLLMVILLESAEEEKGGGFFRFRYLCGILCGILCVAVKHFGALIVILYFVCHLCMALCHRKPFFHYLSGLFLCLFAGSFFYSGEGFWFYIEVMFLHNPYFDFFDGIIIISLFLAFSAFIIWWFRRRPLRSSDMKLAGRGLFVWLQIGFFLVYMGLTRPGENGSVYFYLFFTVFSLSAFWTLFMVPAASMALYAVFYATMGTAWFFFLFAYHIDFFVFPFLLLFYLSVREGLSRFSLFFLVLCGLFVSNWFEFFQSGLYKSVPGAVAMGIEERLFNSFSWRPLDWQPMQMKKIRQETAQILHPYLLDGRVYGLAANMNFKAQQEMNWPPYFFVDGALGREEQTLQEISASDYKECFLRWHEEGRVPVLVEAMNHWNQYESGGNNFELSFFIRELASDKGPAIRADFVSFIGDQFMVFMRETGLLTDYKSYPIPAEYPLLWLHVRKDLLINSDYDSEEPIINIYNKKRHNPGEE
jgi:hypothetical protein